MDENQYRILSNAEFAARLGVTEEQLSGMGEYFKKNPPRLSSPVFTSANPLPIDPSTVHGSIELIDQLKAAQVELKHFHADNQRLVEELKAANNKIVDISQQLDNAQKDGRFASAKNIALTVIGGVALAFVLWFIGVKLGIQL